MDMWYLECGDFVGFGGSKFGKPGKIGGKIGKVIRRRFCCNFLKNLKYF